MAKTKGIRALQVEKQRKEAEEKQRREQQVKVLSHFMTCCRPSPARQDR